MDLPKHSDSYQTMADEALMLAYAANDSTAFEHLYARHKGGVFRYLLRQVDSRATAEELFQEVWMKLINARENYEPRAKFTTWLYTLAHNHLVDHYRKHAKGHMQSYSNDEYDPLELVPDREALQPEQRTDLQMQTEQVVSAIEALPAAQRETLMMKLETDMTLEGIADATGVTRETTKSRLRYALNRLKQQLGVSP